MCSYVFSLNSLFSAGEVLFVPSGCPHYVENITQSVAISANFVDPSNLLPVLTELSINALRDPRAAELHQQLTDKCADLVEDMNNLKSLNRTRREERTVNDGINDSCEDSLHELKRDVLPPSIQAWMNDVECKGHREWQDFKA